MYICLSNIGGSSCHSICFQNICPRNAQMKDMNSQSPPSFKPFKPTESELCVFRHPFLTTLFPVALKPQLSRAVKIKSCTDYVCQLKRFSKVIQTKIDFQFLGLAVKAYFYTHCNLIELQGEPQTFTDYKAFCTCLPLMEKLLLGKAFHFSVDSLPTMESRCEHHLLTLVLPHGGFVAFQLRFSSSV